MSLGFLGLQILANIVEEAGLVHEDATRVETCDDPLVSRALAFIWNHAHRKITITDIADATATHPRTLQRRFARSGVGTIQHHLNHCRLQHACDLLRTTTLSVKEIAYTVGFSHPKRLNEHFQRLMNEPPLAFRSRCRTHR